MPVVLAVGDEFQPDVLLQAHHAADRVVLDTRQLGRRQRALFDGFPCLDQRIGPDQAADMVGAERRFHSLLHGSVVRFLWSFPRKREPITTARDHSARPVIMAPRFRGGDKRVSCSFPRCKRMATFSWGLPIATEASPPPALGAVGA